jgi:hypothetical protein
VAKFVFAGFPRYVEVAAKRIGHPEVGLPAGRISALASLANLCAQASDSQESLVPGILDKAEEFHHQLRVATLAAELMIEDVRKGKSVHPPVPLKCPPLYSETTPQSKRSR